MALTVNLIAAISIAYLAALAVSVVCRLVRGGRKSRYAFLKGFKKGSCFLVYLGALPLYLVALLEGGQAVGRSIFLSVKYSVELIVLKYDFSSLTRLMDGFPLFRAAVYFCYGLVLCNALSFTFTLFGLRLMNALYRRAALRQADAVYIIAGYNRRSLDILDSVLAKGRRAVLLADHATAEKKDDIRTSMYVRRTAHIEYSQAGFGAFLRRVAAKYAASKAVNVILNAEDAAENLLLVRELCAVAEECGFGKRRMDARNGINGYVFCLPEDVATFMYFEEKSHGCVRCVNKYKLISFDFAERYPLSDLVRGETEGDFPALREGVQPCVVMLGFGKLCRELFCTLVSTQQFACLRGDAVQPVPVRYCIYDRADGTAEKELNHNYRRFGEFCCGTWNAQEYLPCAAAPAQTEFRKMDISDPAFYAALRADLSGEGRHSALVVSFGTDLENFDLARKLQAKIREWGLADRVRIFAKIRDARLSERVLDGMAEGVPEFFLFGNEKSTAYHIDSIVDERMEQMAKRRHLSYTAESGHGKSAEEIALIAQDKWYLKNSRVQRDSNVFACLALRSKLRLLGFDYTAAPCDDSAALAAWQALYERGDPVGYTQAWADGRRTVEYRNADFERLSARRVFAELEHLRWNAAYICQGFVPASRADIAADREGHGKDFALRRHGCLTTFAGLKEYRAIAAQSEGAGEEETDVIRYDYQILDDLVWLLHGVGLRLVREKG